jgi:hypothetical protein
MQKVVGKATKKREKKIKVERGKSARKKKHVPCESTRGVSHQKKRKCTHIYVRTKALMLLLTIYMYIYVRYICYFVHLLQETKKKKKKRKKRNKKENKTYICIYISIPAKIC